MVDRLLVGREYASHLTDADLRLLASVAGAPAGAGATTHALGLLDAGRLLRAARLPSSQQERLAGSPALDLWEYLGARWYRAARELAPADTARVVVVGDVADRFRQARRVLNHLADRYLLAPDQPWFEQPSW